MVTHGDMLTTGGRTWSLVRFGSPDHEGRRASCDHCGTYLNIGGREPLAWRHVGARGIEWLACTDGHARRLTDRLDRAPFVTLSQWRPTEVTS